MKQLYDENMVNYFLSDKNYGGSGHTSGADELSLRVDKLANSRAALYARGNKPYFFTTDTKSAPIIPTLYALMAFNPISVPNEEKVLVPLSIYLKEGV